MPEMVVKRRLQCNVCGSKSGEVLNMPPSPKEEQMLQEFRMEHEETCGRGEVSPETPQIHGGPFGSKKPPARSIGPTRKIHGRIERMGPYGEQEILDVLSCCHCRSAWEIRTGWEHGKGFCHSCMMVTCGRAECEPCIPYDLRIENCLRGIPELTPRPQQILIPSDPTFQTTIRQIGLHSNLHTT